MFQIYVGQYETVEITLCLTGMIIHMAVYGIQLLRFLSLEDQHECMVTRCNRFIMVAHDIFYRATWRPVNTINRQQDV